MKSAEQLVKEIETGFISEEEATRICFSEIETPCLICDEFIPVFGRSYEPKICEKCKAAVMKVRAEDGT